MYLRKRKYKPLRRKSYYLYVYYIHEYGKGGGAWLMFSESSNLEKKKVKESYRGNSWIFLSKEFTLSIYTLS